MLERIILLAKTLQIGEEAKNYARERIKKGRTQLENNNLSGAYFNFLREGVGEVRKLSNERIIEKTFSDPLENEPTLAFYESIIAVTSKYSMGNCRELAFQALDYILNHVSADINAEVFKIQNGDHAFLVLNRDPDSDPRFPKTWGKSAVICDPLLDKVYKASDYLAELKNFYTDKHKNYIEDFNPFKHVLVPINNFNTRFLRQVRTVANLKANFLSESKRLVQTLEEYKNKLQSEENRLRETYGDNDQKVLVIANKIRIIDRSIHSTNDVTHSLTKKKYKNDYQFAKTELMNEIGRLKENSVHAMQFSRDEQSILFEHKGKDAKTEVMKFLGIKTVTQSHLEDITEDVNKALKNRVK